MRLFLSFLLIGVLLMISQGALARWFPPPFCPDFGLLLVMCLGLRWPNFSTGVLLAGLLGFSADLLSGSLMGQQALLRILVFTASFIAGRQFNIRGPLPLMAFVVTMSFLYGVALYLLSLFFIGAAVGSGAGWLADNVWHSFANAIFAPLVFSLCSRIFVWVIGDEANEHPLKIQMGRGSM